MKEQVAEIVASYLKKNKVNPDEIAGVIGQVYSSLSRLGQPLVMAEAPRPAVPIRRSVGPDAITCLSCGYRGQMLKRHLTSAHHLTPDEYRKQWNLPIDYPMVAISYSTRRSELAKQFGLGKGRKRRKRR